VKLASQVFVSHTLPEPRKVEPIEDRQFWKPAGGLWTSTLNEEGGEWVRWLTGENYDLEDERWGGKLWLLEPGDANLFVAWGPRELYELVERYPHPLATEKPELSSFKTMLDWPAVASEYDGVHVPNPWPWRFGHDDLGAAMFFYSMDAECTCWFRWCFEGDPVELDPEPFLLALKGE
jgi:hypothetical protein